MKNVKPGHAKPIVCLDAGHYGKYNRSPVVKDYYESDMNWKLHNYLAIELDALGIEVRKTRATQAKDMELTARGRASKGADLFISLHSNACGAESVDRPVAIYLMDDDCGHIDEASKEISVLLAEIVREVMQTKDKAQTYSRKSSGDRDGDGKKNDDYYGVLFGCHQVGTAGLILEHSFHTNTRAAKWLLVDDNLKALAKAEAKTIAAWFGISAAAPAPEPEKPQEKPEPVEIKVDPARQFNKGKAGVYQIKSSDGTLNLRAGAHVSKQLIEVMKTGEKVRCYGYFTGDWLYVVSASGKKGFCHSGYLVKQ